MRFFWKNRENILSAKLKLTAWNSLLMILMASLVFGLILSFSDDIIAVNSETVLTNVVEANADELEFEDGVLELDDIDFFKSGVYTLLYTQKGERLAGNLPIEFVNEPPLKDKGLGQVNIEESVYYVYDRLVLVEDYPTPVWVRGVMAVDEIASAMSGILRMALLSLPFFIVLATIGCYFIAKRTFRPIDQIINTAKQISHSENLSLRIHLKNGDAEMQKLAQTFDTMFERLEKAFEAEKQFSQNVSHELRTPTAVILAQCEYSLDSKSTEQDRYEALEIIQKQARKTSRLISDLLSLIRLEIGLEKDFGKNEFTKVDFSELVTMVCEEQTVIKPQHINFIFHISHGIFLNADQNMMIRLVTNLLSNAFRYSKEKGEVKLSLSEDDQAVVLTVEDNGIGIASEEKEKIWQRFYQADKARVADSNSSMGLGLAMVKQICKIHNAQIGVSSELGKGSCFTIAFQTSPKTHIEGKIL